MKVGTETVDRHIFCLGAEHNVCSRCGFDLLEKSGDRYSPCPDNLPDVTKKILSAALLTGYKRAVCDVFSILENARQVAITEGQHELAEKLWRLSRDLPRPKTTKEIYP